MPLDGHSHLVKQGWGGSGNGLRDGAISRPLAIPQKKNFAGLGKDRDEAFPFWDHVFAAAAKSIQVKCFSDDEENDSDQSNENKSSLKRTSTGILSNRRPLEGTPATSGSSTPAPESEGVVRKISLISTAKRDAAKRNLYSRFFRGPVLGPEVIVAEEKRLSAIVDEALKKQKSGAQKITMTEHIDIQTATEHLRVDMEVSGSVKRKRKSKEKDEDEEARRMRKKRRKEKKRKINDHEAMTLKVKKAEKKRRKRNGEDKESEGKKGGKKKGKDDEETLTTSTLIDGPDPAFSLRDEVVEATRPIAEDAESRTERRLRKAEKKRLKELKSKASGKLEGESDPK